MDGGQRPRRGVQVTSTCAPAVSLCLAVASTRACRPFLEWLAEITLKAHVHTPARLSTTSISLIPCSAIPYGQIA